MSSTTPGNNGDIGSTGINYTDLDQVYVDEPEEGGDGFKKVTITKREADDDEESGLFVSLKEGYAVTRREAGTGEPTLVEEIENTRSLGIRPEDIGDLVDSLETLGEAFPV